MTQLSPSLICSSAERWLGHIRLPECNSIRRGRGPAQTEIWFRIRHVALDGGAGQNRPSYCEQTVEVTLGPKGAFKNGNLGVLTRRVTADRVVSVLPKPRGRPKPPKQPKTPRVVELLQMAIEWQRQLDAGEVDTQAEIARREGITRARVTQVMGMLRLTPGIQEHILALPNTCQRQAITERALRPIAHLESTEQLGAFQALIRRSQRHSVGDQKIQPGAARTKCAPVQPTRPGSLS